jgi:hypothetical protein
MEIQLQLTIAEQGADAERLDDLARSLIQDLQDLSPEYVKPPPEEPTQAGKKSADLTLGTLTKDALPVFLPKLVDYLEAWTQRGENRTIKIEISGGPEVEITSETRSSQ